MGLFGNIKSKPKPDPDNEFVLNYIAGRDGLGSIKGDSVVINKTGLTVTLGGCKVEENEGRFAAYLFFRIDRADFDEPVFEPQTSLGNSREKALTTAAEQFVTVLMSMVLSIGMKHKCEEMRTLENSFDGSRHIYEYPCTLPVGRLSNSNAERECQPFDVVKDDLADYLGGRKYNWVKLFVGRTGESVTCEARVNGVVIPELTDKLSEFADCDEDKTSINMEKQCILFIQSDETYKPPRHTFAEIKKCALKAVPILAEIHGDDSWDKGFAKINRITHDPILTCEIIHYLPEAAAQIMFNEVKTVTPITLYCGETEPLVINRTQLTAWCAASSAIEDFYYTQKPDSKYMFAIMNYLSSLYSVVCQIMEKHPDLQSLSGLTFKELGCNMPEEYRNEIY